MLLGEFHHTLDDKNRVSLPAKFRKEIGKKVVITRGLDPCLSVYSMSEWKKFSDEITSQTSFNHANSRAYDRFITSGAVETEMDSAGRILIPDFLKHYGNLGNKVVIAGVRNRLELWNEDAWSDYIKKVEADIAVLSEQLNTNKK